jgi:bacterioferritin-associated ferredoxin
MIVCSCNVLTDHDVRSTLTGEEAARTAGEVYGCLGCSAQCGRCARTIRRIMDEALASAEGTCCRAQNGVTNGAAHGADNGATGSGC